MKKLLVLSILFLLFTSFQTKAQRFESGAGLETSKVGYKYMIQIGVGLGNKWRVSAYYKSDLNKNFPETGILTEFRILKLKPVTLNCQVTSGIVNKLFITAYPGANLKIFLTRNLGISSGVNLRHRKISYNVKVFIRI